MADDPEIAALKTAYQALRCLSPAEWTRALNYLADRLADDARSVHDDTGDCRDTILADSAMTADQPFNLSSLDSDG